MNIDYHELILARPVCVKNEGNIQYFENPFFSDMPILKVDRQKMEVVETDVFDVEFLKR